MNFIKNKYISFALSFLPHFTLFKCIHGAFDYARVDITDEYKVKC